MEKGTFKKLGTLIMGLGFILMAIEILNIFDSRPLLPIFFAIPSIILWILGFYCVLNYKKRSTWWLSVSLLALISFLGMYFALIILAILKNNSFHKISEFNKRTIQSRILGASIKGFFSLIIAMVDIVQFSATQDIQIIPLYFIVLIFFIFQIFEFFGGCLEQIAVKGGDSNDTRSH